MVHEVQRVVDRLVERGLQASSDFWVSAPAVGNDLALRIDPLPAAFVEFVRASTTDVVHEKLFRLYVDTSDCQILGMYCPCGFYKDRSSSHRSELLVQDHQ